MNELMNDKGVLQNCPGYTGSVMKIFHIVVDT